MGFKEKILEKKMNETFLYFAFGSNLNSKRIHINSPTAKFIGFGRLDNWRLIFCWESSRWRGGVASIEPCEGEHVIGCIWQIGIENLSELGVQEGVDQNIYTPIH